MTEPALGKQSFTCGHCGAHAHQFWYKFLSLTTPPPVITPTSVEQLLQVAQQLGKEGVAHDLPSRKPAFVGKARAMSVQAQEISSLWATACYSCKQLSIWVGDKMVFPHKKPTLVINNDLAPEIKADIEEALSIVEFSPRGAAALLRLALQKLCTDLTGKKNINSAIGAQAKKGIDQELIQAMDILRVVGNHAIHPGQIDMRDNREIVFQLFNIIDVIADRLVTQPKKISKIYGALPAGDLKAIEERDRKSAKVKEEKPS